MTMTAMMTTTKPTVLQWSRKIGFFCSTLIYGDLAARMAGRSRETLISLRGVSIGSSRKNDQRVFILRQIRNICPSWDTVVLTGYSEVR